MAVGRSWHTYAKNPILRSTLGQEIGVFNSLPHLHRAVWIDLTAGDGVAVDGEEWHHGCSIGIMAGHALAAKKPLIIIACEIQAGTYDQLLVSLAERLPVLGYRRVAANHWEHGALVD